MRVNATGIVGFQSTLCKVIVISIPCSLSSPLFISGVSEIKLNSQEPTVDDHKVTLNAPFPLKLLILLVTILPRSAAEQTFSCGDCLVGGYEPCQLIGDCRFNVCSSNTYRESTSDPISGLLQTCWNSISQSFR